MDKTALQRNVSSITARLVDAKATMCEIEEERVSIAMSASVLGTD